MRESFLNIKFYNQIFLFVCYTVFSCAPPATTIEETNQSVEPVSEMQCLRLLSSAAEYYKNKDWESTSRVYGDLVKLNCDKGVEDDVFQYWAIAFENMAKFDSSEYVLLQGLKRLPDNINLRKRLAFAYKKLGNKNKEIFEYEKLIDLQPNDIESLNSLNELYMESERYEDQIFTLNRILDIDENNKNAQGDLAIAYEKTGRDPIDVYRKRFEDNPENISFGIDLSDQLINDNRTEEAIEVLEEIYESGKNISSVSIKLVLQKLANAHFSIDDLNSASNAYENLFEINTRDFKTAIEIAKINTSLLNFKKALYWSESAIKIAPDNGQTYASKGNVYYAAFNECRSNLPNVDDKIVSTLALKYFKIAEDNGFRRSIRDRKYLEDNADDLTFGKADWFMLDDSIKRKGSISVKGDCYSWVSELVKKELDW